MASAILCELCPHNCLIPEGQAGDCRVRLNLHGRLVATTYARPSAVHIDPIEKKPLNHFLPGSTAFSIATAGCNLHCRHCQNWQLSQRGGEEMEVRYRAEPSQVVETAIGRGCWSIAYTYSDPIIFYEYVSDTARMARDRGVKNVFVTGGYINRKPLRELCRVLDATNTDLKGFTEEFYHDECGGSLRPVLDALVTFKEEGVWLEVTNLIIPSLNDDMATFRRMCKWMRDNLGDDTPLHISRFTPMYRTRNLPATPVETLLRAREEALDVGLKFAYIGNLFGHPAESTHCPYDGRLLVRRVGYRVTEMHIVDGKCEFCRRPIAGRWSREST